MLAVLLAPTWLQVVKVPALWGLLLAWGSWRPRLADARDGSLGHHPSAEVYCRAPVFLGKCNHESF